MLVAQFRQVTVAIYLYTGTVSPQLTFLLLYCTIRALYFHCNSMLDIYH